MAASRALTAGWCQPPRVEVCVDLDDEADVIRGIHRDFVLAEGHPVVTAAPANSADDLIRTMLLTLNVLWRLPAKLRPGGVSLHDEGRAIAEWEISWALSRIDITSLSVIDADQANLFAWLWLRHTAQREALRLFLRTTTIPDPWQAAALAGCRVRAVSPEQLKNRQCRSLTHSPAGTGTPSLC
ncbi:MAG TPA: hypothetical protein VFP89_06395 [Propionibacteriaceae bacterium]|nr:hypothetical protein [Propionibacteriaceae bacterium]